MIHVFPPSADRADVITIYQSAETFVEQTLLDGELPFPVEHTPLVKAKRELVRLDYILTTELLTNLGVVVKNDTTGSKYVFGVNRHTHAAQLVSKH